jgi:hypothetical protein
MAMEVEIQLNLECLVSGNKFNQLCTFALIHDMNGVGNFRIRRI